MDCYAKPNIGIGEYSHSCPPPPTLIVDVNRNLSRGRKRSRKEGVSRISGVQGKSPLPAEAMLGSDGRALSRIFLNIDAAANRNTLITLGPIA